MPYTPARYSPRDDWERRLQTITPPAGSWQADLVAYWQLRKSGQTPLRQAWADVAMSPEHAKAAIKAQTAEPTASNDSGVVPPEIFGRLLARSVAKTIDPDDEMDIVLEPAPPQPPARTRRP